MAMAQSFHYLSSGRKSSLKDDSHGALIGCACIFQVKGHHRVMELPMGVLKAVFSASDESVLIWL